MSFGMKVLPTFSSFAALFLCVMSASAFAPPVTGRLSKSPQTATTFGSPALVVHPSLERQRKSVTGIQTQSLFGLGAPELLVIGIAAVFLLGPEKIGEVVRSSGKMASELKDELKTVPEEFQKGLEEGEINSKARVAKPMNPPEQLELPDQENKK